METPASRMASMSMTFGRSPTRGGGGGRGGPRGGGGVWMWVGGGGPPGWAPRWGGGVVGGPGPRGPGAGRGWRGRFPPSGLVLVGPVPAAPPLGGLFLSPP